MKKETKLKFRSQFNPHAHFVKQLNAKLQSLGYTILTNTYQQSWNYKDHDQSWNQFHPIRSFIRYKPDILALRNDQLFWLEAKTSGKSHQIYFPFTKFILSAVLAYLFELPIVWAYRDHEGWERAWKAAQHWNMIPMNLKVYVGANLEEHQWKPEYDWVLSLISRAGFRIAPTVKSIEIRGSGTPFIALSKNKIKSLKPLDEFLGEL